MKDNTRFKAMVVRDVDGTYVRKIEERSVGDLTTGNLTPDSVLINVRYSSLNYKDALSATGNRGITRSYPHTPGIDAAGIVAASSTSQFKEGDEVICTSYDLGMNTPGGFGQYIRAPASWVVRLPCGLTLKESMIYGTAGFTAAQSLLKLESLGVAPSDDDEALVTGATGGVGSMAVALLASAGFTVTAATGKADRASYLRTIGASTVIGREDISDVSEKPLMRGRWQAVIDTVGGNVLAAAIKSTKQWGSIAACGLTQSADLHTSVFPFILRGVNLLGINSERCPMPLRTEIWRKIATEWKTPFLNIIGAECTLKEADKRIDAILNGQITGRTVINLEENRGSCLQG